MSNNFFYKRIISSGLDEISFGKIRMTNMISEQKGLLATTGTENGDINFSDWKFTGTAKDKEEKVWLCGEIFTDAEPLSDILEKHASNETSSEEKEKCAEKILFAEKVLTKIIDSNLDIPEIGGGGIFISEDAKSAVILPGEIFELCTTNESDRNGKFYSEKQGFYIYKGLKETDKTIFTRAAIAYKSITGKFPYENTDLSGRQTDIFDRKFIPTAYTVNGIGSGIADAIDAGLSLPIKFETLPGEMRYKNEKADKIRKELLDLSLTFDIEKYKKELFTKNEERKLELPKEEFDARTKKFVSSRDFRINVSRFGRRNKTRIIVSVAVLLGFIWAFNSFQETNGILATSLGLDSTKTVAAFYSKMHNADVPNLQELAKGKKMKDFVKIITGFYVMGKERETYNAKDRTVPPEDWIFYKPEFNYWIYGITNLKIDGENFSSQSECPIRKDKVPPIKDENGKTLSKGDVTTHDAEYFFIHTDSSRVSVETIKEKVTLEWNGKRWTVTELSPIGKSKIESIKLKNFAEEYKKALDEYGGSVKKAAEALREKYAWLPADADMKRGAKEIFDRYELTSAKDYLSEK